MRYYRHYVRYRVYGENDWIDSGFNFTTFDADALVRQLTNDRTNYVISRNNEDVRDRPPMIEYKIMFTHEISEEDYNDRKIYSIPIAQYTYNL